MSKHKRKYSSSFSSSFSHSKSSSSISLSSSISSKSSYKKRKNRSRSSSYREKTKKGVQIQSVINVVAKPKETKKGRGFFHKGDSNGLLAWEDDDYENANKKLMNYGVKFKSHYYKYNRREVSR